ncbi:MAG: SPOR domain-containing protein [Pseudomonadota bacterium]
MADAQYDAGFDDSEHGELSGLMAGLLHWIGAVSSVALVGGLLYWGYELTMRDVAEIPVVRALEGPARVQPDDPGGQLASHQGLAVNTVQSEGEAEGPAPRIVLAPDAIEIPTEDIVIGAAPEAVEDPQIATAAPIEQPLTEVPDGMSEADRTQALADALAENTQTSPAADDSNPAALEIATIARSIPGVSQSPRPDLRPKITRVSFDQSEAVSAAVAAALNLAAVETDPSALAPGTRLVQLGAFDTREAAEAAWDDISVQFSDYMEGKQRVVQQTESGGRNFFRLRAAGFDGLSASRRFCAVLVAKNAVCIPILAR